MQCCRRASQVLVLQRSCVAWSSGRPANVGHHVTTYVWNMLSRNQDVSHPSDVLPHIPVPASALPHPRECALPVCRILAVIPVAPHRFDVRQAVRVTWAATARAYGVHVVFAVGVMARGGSPEPPTYVDGALAHEQAQHEDLVFTNTTESYANLAIKVRVWPCVCAWIVVVA